VAAVKDSCHGRWAFRLDVDKEYHCRDVFSKQVDLAYNTKNILKSLRPVKERIWF